MEVTLASCATHTRRLCGVRSVGRWRFSRLAAVIVSTVVFNLLPPHLQAQAAQEVRGAGNATSSTGEADSRNDRSVTDGGVTSPAVTTRPTLLIDDAQARNWWRSFVWAMVLVLVFVFGSMAIIVFSRRFRAYLTGSPQKPTSCDDVWRMHKLPPDAGNDDDPPGGHGRSE